MKFDKWAIGGLVLAGGSLIYNLFRSNHDQKVAEEKNNEKLEKLFNNYVSKKEESNA